MNKLNKILETHASYNIHDTYTLILYTGQALAKIKRAARALYRTFETNFSKPSCIGHGEVLEICGLLEIVVVGLRVVVELRIVWCTHCTLQTVH
jgi:hypothetical protein